MNTQNTAEKTAHKFYGFAFNNNNHDCTYGEPNETTGRYSIAGNSEVFRTKKERDEWVESSPWQREACTKRELRGYNLGCPVEDFETELEYSEFDRYEM